jgi:hypothetical protein
MEQRGAVMCCCYPNGAGLRQPVQLHLTMSQEKESAFQAIAVHQRPGQA